MLQASPLQMAVAYSALANGGTVVTPHVAGAVLRGESVKPLVFKPARKLKLTTSQAIRDGLYEAAHSPGGTSASVFCELPRRRRRQDRHRARRRPATTTPGTPRGRRATIRSSSSS